ncbi:hypothetical protein HMF8227_00217 [Saliniradius amylolyticus]|uniref:Uncharacterized protein n=1 Tax=Saliniradius amylolyticus TaxID=2183582 RepID=A0A2S2DZ88_9ALTE|nr:DUF6445 family protein [Saliniradius amylolyticus]AWL10725.1 hypothetical protein HMF8227_00217 [Saliniradius amylolyticus]
MKDPGQASDIFCVGTEQTPVISLAGDFSHQRLAMAATQETWIPGGNAYPGIRAQVPGDYFEQLIKQMAPALKQAYGLTPEQIDEAFCCFSLATQCEQQLTRLQSVPHFDAITGRQLAMVHYLCESPFDGTGFFRQRQTGIENVTQDNLDRYQTVLDSYIKDVEPGYSRYCDQYYDCLYQQPAQINRIVLYPASLLHSGLVNDDRRLTDDPQSGRLTITGFLNFTHPVSY